MQVLCESPALQSPEAAPLWGSLLQALLDFLQQQATSGGAADADAGHEGSAAEEGFGGYTSSYARLGNAAKEDPDPLPGIADTNKYLAASLASSAQVSCCFLLPNKCVEPGRLN